MVLGAFLAGLAAVLAATVFAVVRGIALWRQTRRTGGILGRELASFEERSALTERHLAEWEHSSHELEQSVERFRRSRAQLRILLDAIERARERVRWLSVFVPR